MTMKSINRQFQAEDRSLPDYILPITVQIEGIKKQYESIDEIW